MRFHWFAFHHHCPTATTAAKVAAAGMAGTQPMIKLIDWSILSIYDDMGTKSLLNGDYQAKKNNGKTDALERGEKLVHWLWPSERVQKHKWDLSNRAAWQSQKMWQQLSTITFWVKLIAPFSDAFKICHFFKVEHPLIYCDGRYTLMFNWPKLIGKLVK
jgi:hypothetical protein